ncbi:GNAT family N-acetyltransferase [Thalassobacillus sp. C254]|uniref:GNAT family N-acetyltransferase n=1 Tax=Thalassobacillus sp. C254 TaxID=1225341 RepID=UPI0006D15252|nr:GNAT family N-acetyltransferase [Thalassobacillus sp. C254]
MEIRKMKTSEIDQVMELGQFAFQLEMNSEELEERKKFINPENVWVAAGEDEIYSKLTILPMEVYIGPHKLSAGGVSGVATWPEKRRNGLVSQLLAASLKDMKDRGIFCLFCTLFLFLSIESMAGSSLLTQKNGQFPKINCQFLMGNQQVQ